jgi:hypothetical protein
MAASASAPSKMEYNEVVVPDDARGMTPIEFAERKRQNRLGFTLAERTVLGSISAFAVGAILGASHGGRKDGLRFRAENAHRLPKSQKGWYLYHKSKNYAAMFGGMKEGMRMALRTSVWTVGFIMLEAAADSHRGYGGKQDFLSTATAGVVTAAFWSAWHRFPAATTVRTAMLGLKIGVGYGLAQDLLGLVRGRELSYVEYGKKVLGYGKKWQE